MKTEVVITIDKHYLNNLEAIAHMLQKNDGLQIDSVQDYGLIMGSADTKNLDNIRRHEEVVAVEASYVQLPPPTSEIQ